VRSPQPPGVKLDAIDIKILAALQRDGRITKLRLADEVNLSPSPCWERMRRLERAGYIRGYHAEIELSRIIRHVTVFVEITLESHAASDFARFESAVTDVPEVVECHAIGGGVDYLLKVLALDIAHYQELIDRLLEARIGIARYFTYVVTKPVKTGREVPFRQLLDRLEAAERGEVQR
jgi:Lrp/AsnC family transcriptional regulator, regulator of ectoine-degradation genes